MFSSSKKLVDKHVAFSLLGWRCLSLRVPIWGSPPLLVGTIGKSFVLFVRDLQMHI